jgi:DNA invertase Pin-like site-specific DNA recombinase
MRAVVYARYSSDQQRATSIDDQIRLCKERVAREGWKMVQVYRDTAMSGATAFRPGYQAMLEGAREAAFDVVVTEALDRLSRDQEDVAALFKRLQFAGIRLVTLGEGDIGVLHIGLKGTMNALFLKDLADKTRRGLRGRVEAGRSGGGNAYGYDLMRGYDPNGELVRGGRTINAAEAEVVREVFARYSAGESPRRIAFDLNARRVSAPRGGAWSASTLNGNRGRGTGILNNEMYVGRLVWNRLSYVKDPDTGKRRSRANASEAVVAVEVPELAIMSRELWDAVKNRQAGLDQRAVVKKLVKTATNEPVAFWSKRRPRYLFSGLMRCGVCGGGFSKISEAHFGCSTARNKGETVCSNRLIIRRDALEATVMEGLSSRLMDPDLFKVFAKEFAAEWNRLQAEAESSLDRVRSEHQRVCQQIDRLVDALADGEPAVARTP